MTDVDREAQIPTREAQAEVREEIARVHAARDRAWKEVERLEDEITHAQNRIRQLEAEVVWGFYEGDKPLYLQGYNNASEICSIVTADECNGLVEAMEKWVADRGPRLAEVIIRAIEQAMAEARAKAIEDAAQVAMQYGTDSAIAAAYAIHALTKPSG